MKILNDTKTLVLTEAQCDLSMGYLKPDKIKIGERQSLIEQKENFDGSATTTTYSNLNIEEDVLIYVPYTQKQLNAKEKQELEHWFETEYREMFEKCTRKIKLGIMMRDGRNPQMVLDELYAQAETKSNRINQLKQLINN